LVICFLLFNFVISWAKRAARQLATIWNNEPQNQGKANRRTAEYRMSKGGFARAAQALAPRVAQSFL
jgi:hypothetical protein